MGLFSIVFFVFFFRSNMQIDPDYFWHIRMGEIIVKEGIPKTDPLSYTMPNFPFIDHEWLSNIVLYGIHRAFGMQGNAIVFSGIATIFLLLIFQNKPSVFKYSLLFTTIILAYAFIGVRLQIISWVYVGIFLYILAKNPSNKTNLLWLLVVVLMWVNTHGSFPLSLVIFFCYMVDRLLRNKLTLFHISLFLLMIVTTLINPYGFRMWWEIWNQMSDFALHFRIKEWVPTVLILDASTWMFVGISLAFFIFLWKNTSYFLKMTYIFLFVFAMSALRHFPFFLLISLYFMQKGQEYIFSLAQINNKLLKANYVFWALSALIVVIGFSQLLIYKNEYFNPFVTYPDKAIEYFQHNYKQKRLFTTYEWGGFYAWKTRARGFIDGRMPSWKSCQKSKCSSAMEEYFEIINGNTKQLNKYHVEYILYPKIKTLQRKNPFAKKRVVYEDNMAFIYKW